MAVPSAFTRTVVPAAAAAASSSSLLFLGMVLQYTLDWVLRRENASAPVALTCNECVAVLDQLLVTTTYTSLVDMLLQLLECSVHIFAQSSN